MVKVISCNVNGIRDPIKRKTLFSFFKNTKADIVLLQETHSCSNTMDKWTTEWEGDAIWNSGTTFQCGVAILLRQQDGIIDIKADTHGRILKANVTLHGRVISVMSVYSPNRPHDRENFFSQFETYFDHTEAPIIGGDFNMVTDWNLDRCGGTYSPTHLYGINSLVKFITQYNLVDTYRHIYPHKKSFTWSNPSNTVKSRLDRIYHKVYSVMSAFTIKTPLTDHDSVGVTFSFENENRGPGYWKLNSMILDDDMYDLSINRLWNYWKSQKGDLPLDQWWDIAKSYIKQISIKYTKLLNRTFHYKTKEIISKIKRLDARDHSISILLNELNELYADKNMGAFLRSKQVLAENGEKPTKHFFLLEKFQQDKKTIKMLKTPENVTIEGDKNILQYLQNFYQKLFTKANTAENIQNELLQKVQKVVPNSMHDNLIEEITLEEIKNALKTCEDFKSPGLDGITYEFYKKFIHLIGEDLKDIFNFSLFNKKQLPQSSDVAIISLTPKGGDLSNANNWRPISLLNCDYKIITKILANRLKPILPKIIGEQQTCTVGNRHISSNLLLFRDIIQFAHLKKVKAFLLHFDQEKAFDKVDRKFLLRVLSKYGFPSTFIKFIEITFKNTKAMVINNGYFSNIIDVQRGVRQGDPLALPLYIINAEIIALNILSDSRISPLDIPLIKNDEKISQYADDTTFLLGEEENVKYIYDFFEKYKLATGSTINLNKTKGLPIGGFIPSDENVYSIKWNNHIKLLGVIFYDDLIHSVNVNWTKVITELEKRANSLRYRFLSFKGKTMYLNCLLLSKVWYLANILLMPSWAQTKINKIIFSAFWGSETDPIQRKILHNKIDNGGTNLLNVKRQNVSLHIKYILSIAEGEGKTLWDKIAKFYLAHLLYSIDKNEQFRKIAMDNKSPKCIFNSDIPSYYINLIPYLKIFFKNFKKKHGNQYPKLKLVSVRDIRTLLQKDEPKPLIKGEIYWNTKIQKNLKWNSIWENTFLTHTIPFYTNILFKLRHNIIPSNMFLSKRSRNTKFNIKCKTCGQNEDAYHIFVTCPLAAGYWCWALQIIQGFNSNLNISNVILGDYDYKSKSLRLKLLMTLTHISLYNLWTFRNKVKFESSDHTVNDIIDCVRSRLKNFLRKQFNFHKKKNELNKFISQYCIGDVLCHIDHDQLVYNNLYF